MQVSVVEVFRGEDLPWLQAASSERHQAGSKHRSRPVQTASSDRVAPGSAGATRRSPQRAGSEARYVRRWLQPRLPDLCDAVLRSALGGDMEATRLLLRMGGLDGKTETPKKKSNKVTSGFAKKAMDEFRAR